MSNKSGFAFSDTAAKCFLQVAAVYAYERDIDENVEVRDLFDPRSRVSMRLDDDNARVIFTDRLSGDQLFFVPELDALLTRAEYSALAPLQTAFPYSVGEGVFVPMRGTQVAAK